MIYFKKLFLHMKIKILYINLILYIIRFLSLKIIFLTYSYNSEIMT